MLVGPTHTFRHLADAINTAFARWDLNHLHEFVLTDGKRIGIPDDEYDEPEYSRLDDTTLRVADHVHAGDTFSYVFDLGDCWRHRCSVENVDADPSDRIGPLPDTPIPIWGWGDIPDQYGRRWDSDTGEDDEPEDEVDIEF